MLVYIALWFSQLLLALRGYCLIPLVYCVFIQLHIYTHIRQKGRPIETMTIMVDFEGLSLQKHYYWPGIEMVKEVPYINHTTTSCYHNLSTLSYCTSSKVHFVEYWLTTVCRSILYCPSSARLWCSQIAKKCKNYSLFMPGVWLCRI